MSKSGFAKDQLKSFIDRIERLNAERDALSADIREVFAEAKGTGFCTKTMRKVIGMRKLDKADFQEQEATLDLYKDAVGLGDTPLGQYAERAAPAAPKAAPPKSAPEPHGLQDKIAAVLTETGMVRTGDNTWAAPARDVELPACLDRRTTAPPVPA